METNKKATPAQTVVDNKRAAQAKRQAEAQKQLPPLSPHAQQFIGTWCSNMPPAAQGEFVYSLLVEVKRLAQIVAKLENKAQSPIIRPGH